MTAPVAARDYPPLPKKRETVEVRLARHGKAIILRACFINRFGLREGTYA